MEQWFGFTLAALALAGSPGPATLSLAATGAAFGGRRGFGYMAGIVIGMIGVIAIVASGLAGLVLALPGAIPVVIVLSALYFLYLAYRIATAPPLADGAMQGAPPDFLAGFLLSLINPKGYAAMAALFSGFALGFAAKLAILLVIMVAVNFAWLLAGAAMTRLFRDPRTNRIVNIAFAMLLIASVALALAV
ncbi:MAG TPA: LysE family transporter [Dongiaceae bacterium]|nr:LysE family transporter [Dongiaceae bacterium]